MANNTNELSKYDYMADLFGPDMWDVPDGKGSEGPGRAASAPLDASYRAGARSIASNHNQDKAQSSEWVCLHGECSSVPSFHRRWELDRHIRAVHGGLKDFTCPYPGCFQGSHVSAFARPDKLTSHIKACHIRQAQVLLICPAAGCRAPLSRLSDLAGHIRDDHLVDSNPRKQRERCGDEVEILRAVANAVPAAEEEGEE